MYEIKVLYMVIFPTLLAHHDRDRRAVTVILNLSFENAGSSHGTVLLVALVVLEIHGSSIRVLESRST